MDNTLEQLAQYIMQQIRQGTPDAQIRKILAENGWAPPAIDGAFGIVRHYTSHPVLPQPLASGQQPAFQPVNPLQAAEFPVDSSQKPTSAGTPRPLSTIPATPKRKKSKRWLLVIVMVLLFGGIGAGTVFFIQKHANSGKKATPATQQQTSTAKTSQPKINPDTQRKDNLNTMLTNLSDYYIANHTYPTLANLNDPSFLQKQTGIKTAAFTDPSWSTSDEACTSQAAKAILATGPAAHCLAYKASAAAGAACDAQATPCTTLTITAVLQDGTPYAVSLDQNHATN